MPNLSIKDVPETWANALRERAASHHRSLQGELMAILQAAIEHPQAGVVARPQGVRQTDEAGRTYVKRGTKNVEQIYAEHLARFPKPLTGGPLSVDLIREDRDSR